DVGIWVTPRTSLIDQAMDDFSSTGLARQHTGTAVAIFNPAGIIPARAPDRAAELLNPNVKVWLLPYQRIKGLSVELAQLTAAKNVLLIFDEFQLLREISGDKDEFPCGGVEPWFASLEPLVMNCQRKTGFGASILSGD